MGPLKRRAAAQSGQPGPWVVWLPHPIRYARAHAARSQEQHRSAIARSTNAVVDAAAAWPPEVRHLALAATARFVNVHREPCTEPLYDLWLIFRVVRAAAAWALALRDSRHESAQYQEVKKVMCSRRSFETFPHPSCNQRLLSHSAYVSSLAA